MNRRRPGTELRAPEAPESLPGIPAARSIDAKSRAIALWSCYLAGFSTLVDSAVVAYTADGVSSSLGASSAGMQWFLASFSLTFGLGLIPAGRLGDAYGRRVLFIVGLVVFLVGGAVAVVSPDMVTLVAARLLQGLGAGIISAQALGIVQDLTTGTERVKALGTYTAAGAAAALAGPTIAGAILSSVDSVLAWRLLLALPILPTIATIVLVIRGLPPDGHRSTTKGLDLPGVLLLGAAVIAITLTVVDLQVPDLFRIGLVIAAALLFCLFAAWEVVYAKYGRLPLVAPALIRSSGFVLGNVVAMLWFGSNLAALTVMTVHFLSDGKIAPLVLALAFGIGALSRLVASSLGRRVYDRYGSSAILGGLLLQVASYAGMATAALSLDGTALFLVFAGLQVLLGISSGVVEPVLRSVVLDFAPAGVHGAAASVLQLTQRLSATFFVALAAGILVAVASDRPETALAAAIAVCGGAGALAALGSAAPVIRNAAPRRRF